MKRCLCLAAALLFVAQMTPAGEQSVKPLVTGLKNPTALAAGPGGKLYVAVAGEPGKDGSGAIMILDGANAVPFATGIDDPRSLAAAQNIKWLYATDKQRIWRIDMKGKAEVYVAADAFPQPPVNLHGLTIDYESGTLYVADAGDTANKGGAIYRIAGQNPKGFAPKKEQAVNPKKMVSVVTDQSRWPELKQPRGLVLDGQNHLLVLDAGTGSGAIALAIADEHPGARVTAIDASVGALAAFCSQKQRGLKASKRSPMIPSYTRSLA